MGNEKNNLEKQIEKLNKEQKEAVNLVDGPLLILAGAGSGKTSTMTSRIAHMIKDEGINPYNILAVTFTNKAAGEMKTRVDELLEHPTNIWIMTFHAACLRILRANAEVLGYTNSFTIYDPVDCKSVMKTIIKEQNIDDKQFSVASLLGKISDCKEKEMSPEDFRSNYGSGYREDIIFNVYNEYMKVLKRNNAMDFDDLLWNVVKLFKADENILEKYRNRFKYVMVDEYQDTNVIQYKFIKALAKESKNICVVGDDDQCIYQWRGADITNILNFEHDFPGTKVIKLERNYRSTGNILAAAHSVISNNNQRKKKKLWTETDEGEKIVYRRADDEKDEANYIAQEIDRLKTINRSYKDFAILYRTNAQSRNFEEALSARGIPYRVVGGTRYYERKEIKDIIAYMRLVENPQDDLSMRRVINVPKRGIGKKTEEKVAALANVREKSIFSTLMDDDVVATLPKKAQQSIRDTVEALKKYHDERDNLRVSDIYDGVLNATGYIQVLEDENTTESHARLENLLEFKSVIIDYEEETKKQEDEEQLSLAQFLEKVALLSDIDNHDDTEEAVVLMTLHSAKGLEFPFVFMPGMEDGLFPGWRSLDTPDGIEEERRLCYVGITRAKERLCLTSAGYRQIYGSGGFTRESTFMREIDPKLLHGDAVYVKTEDVRHGAETKLDGYSSSTPYKPFDRFAVAKKQVKEKKKNSIILKNGDKVRHGKFGDGLVIEADGNVVNVMFDEFGLKKLAADVAPLTKI